MSQKLYKIISNVMDISISELTDKSGPDNIENWDSYNGLLLIDELESEFDVKFSVDETYDVKTIEDIKRHLKNHGVILND
jgi:acyl carrier protein